MSIIDIMKSTASGRAKIAEFDTMPQLSDRNPDIRIDVDPIPAGCYIHEGKLLPQRAKSAGIPYGIATKRTPCCNSFRNETVGLVIRISDRERMTKAAERPAKTTGKGKP